jgi:hypothetical protein
MTLTISDTAMTSDRSHCTARHSPDRNGWEVSWLPGRLLDRNSAITMTLADTAAEHDPHDKHPLWPAIESWAEELGLTAPEAIARAASQPPSVISRQEPANRQPSGEAAD